MDQYEHKTIDVGMVSIKQFHETATAYGSEGWRVVGLTWEGHSGVAVLERRVVPPAPLADGTRADWYADPCGRWERRYWNGHCWTAHVANVEAKQKGIDAPQTLPDS